MSAWVELPAAVEAGLAKRLEGVSRKDLASRQETISLGYRSGRGSQSITNSLDALAYALVRMPATYAAVRAAMREAVRILPDFAPKSLLDVGTGPGTATWAALATWDSIESARMLDYNGELLHLAKGLAEEWRNAAKLEAVSGVLPKALDEESSAELVVASYALTELKGKALESSLKKLWEKCTSMLVIVEPGTPDGFRRILDCRKQLLAAGATIAAPCTHAEKCPLEAAERWCHFNQRLPRRRDHIAVKAASTPFEDERYAYLVVVKSCVEFSKQHNDERRLMMSPYISKGAAKLFLCAPNKLEEFKIPRSDKPQYKAAKHYAWGDAVETSQNSPGAE